jgi:hypothetical protein
MKVWLTYSDGRFEMTETDKDGPNVVELHKEDWREYQEHLEMDAHWQHVMLGLSNQNEERKNDPKTS